ncbi:MAG: formylglycine-generating enzyme family protein [candidate division KSB1 bacterium]|nr:formylglycine-generating enzyme family protein [candidate division KSB1 bacterium]
MRKLFLLAGTLVALATTVGLFAVWLSDREHHEQLHFERDETELIVANASRATLHLFKAGKSLDDTVRLATFNGNRIWLPRGNYLLMAEHLGQKWFMPVPIIGYRRGPEENGALAITVRSLPRAFPPRWREDLPEFVYIPSGYFLLGDRLNPSEPHYVWLRAFFMSPFEVSNAEFREFLNDPSGYAEDSNWSEAGKQWKAAFASKCTALLKPTDSEFERFGQPDQPVVWVTWFEATAFCHWLTKKWGDGKWQFALPTEAEWEKAARGPDNFDYALGMNISDHEAGWYNWKKNPDAAITVVGNRHTPTTYRPNRFGLYHMSGNVVEWTQSTHRPYNQLHPYVDEDHSRNGPEEPGLRVARGGSWYSASIALLYIPYRDAFQPEHSSQDIGFRVVARMRP